MSSFDDPQFTDFLLRVGNGVEPYIHDNHITIPEDMVIHYKDDETSS